MCRCETPGPRRQLYGTDGTTAGRYSPADCTGMRVERIEGSPDRKHVSTSFVERQNLTMRMGMRIMQSPEIDVVGALDVALATGALDVWRRDGRAKGGRPKW